MSVDGKWNITINSPMGAQKATLDLKANEVGMAELAERYGLAGLTFDHFGPRPDANWSVPIEQLPAAMTEIQELSKAYGFMQK